MQHCNIPSRATKTADLVAKIVSPGLTTTPASYPKHHDS